MTTYATSATTFVGLRAPYALVVHVTPSEKLADLSVVTAASFEVYRNNATTAETMTAMITSQSASEIVLAHTWAEGDNDAPGILRIYPVLTAPGGNYYAAPVSVSLGSR